MILGNAMFFFLKRVTVRTFCEELVILVQKVLCTGIAVPVLDKEQTVPLSHLIVEEFQ